MKNSSGVTINSVVTGNNWGNNVGTPWVIIVGSATEPTGDINGTNAINIIINGKY